MVAARHSSRCRCHSPGVRCTHRQTNNQQRSYVDPDFKPSNPDKSNLDVSGGALQIENSCTGLVSAVRAYCSPWRPSEERGDTSWILILYTNQRLAWRCANNRLQHETIIIKTPNILVTLYVQIFNICHSKVCSEYRSDQFMSKLSNRVALNNTMQQRKKPHAHSSINKIY